MYLFGLCVCTQNVGYEGMPGFMFTRERVCKSLYHPQCMPVHECLYCIYAFMCLKVDTSCGLLVAIYTFKPSSLK